MTIGVQDVVEQLYATYARRDLAAVADCVSDDIVYAMHIDRELTPFGGVSIGKASFLTRLGVILDLFEFLSYDVVSCIADADTVRGQVSYRYRHTPSGVELAGSMRHVFWVRDGLVARLNEYHDRARVEAFMRLVAHETGCPAPASLRQKP